MPAAVRIERATSAPPPESKPYTPLGACAELFRNRARELVLEGPADTGKSRACIEKVHAACTKYAGARWAFIRKTRKSLTETACVTYERWVRPDGASKLWNDLEYRYPNGSRILLLGMDDPGRLLSGEYDGVYIQEVSELEEDDYEIVTTRVTGRGAVMPYSQILCDLNPTYPTFWLYRREAAGKVTFLFTRHADNPTMTPSRLAALDALTGSRYKRLRLGLRVAAEGVFFDEWSPDAHVCKPFRIPDTWKRWRSVDYGYAAPFCCLWFAQDPDTKRVYVYQEAYARGLLAAQQAMLIRNLSLRQPIRFTIADPSMWAKPANGVAGPSIAQMYREGGVICQRANNDRRAGWVTVRRALAYGPDFPPQLQVFSTCANLIRTLPSLVFDAHDLEDLDTTGEDHAADALRYALMAVARQIHQGAMLHDYATRLD